MMGYAVRKTIGAYMPCSAGSIYGVYRRDWRALAAISEEACRGLSAFGVAFGFCQNARGCRKFTRIPGYSILVMTTDEDRIIARQARALIREGSK